MATRKTPIPFPDVGGQIKRYQQLRGYTTAELAQLIDIDSKYLSSLLSGHQMPGIKILYRLSIILNVPLEHLLIVPPEDDVDASIKEQLIRDLDSYIEDELDLLHKLMCDVIPKTRRFKEY